MDTHTSEITFLTCPTKRQRVLAYVRTECCQTVLYQFPYVYHPHVDDALRAYACLLDIHTGQRYMYEWVSKHMDDVIPGERGYRIKHLRRVLDTHPASHSPRARTVAKKMPRVEYIARLYHDRVPDALVPRLVIIQLIQFVCGVNTGKFVCTPAGDVLFFEEYVDLQQQALANRTRLFADLPARARAQVLALLAEPEARSRVADVIRHVRKDIELQNVPISPQHACEAHTRACIALAYLERSP